MSKLSCNIVRLRQQLVKQTKNINKFCLDNSNKRSCKSARKKVDKIGKKARSCIKTN